MIQAISEDIHGRVDWERLYLSVFGSMLRAMKQHGAGGTLIVTGDPEPSRLLAGRLLEFSQTPMEHESTTESYVGIPMYLNSYFLALIRAEKAQTTRVPFTDPQDGDANYGLGLSAGHRIHEAYGELRRNLRFVGELTAADGAVVLRPNLSLYAVGAKIDVPLIKSEQIEVFYADHDTYIKYIKQFDSSYLSSPMRKRGTRFGSGIAYANEVRDALVFIQSADGRLSAAVGLGNNQVLVTEPISLGGDE